MFAQTWNLTPLKIENATVAILAQKINLVYEFVLNNHKIGIIAHAHNDLKYL